MVNLRTEKIRCILCNKTLNYTNQTTQEIFVCGNCRAYFCPNCRQAVIDYPFCPAARLLGVDLHELKFVKILPPKYVLPMEPSSHTKTIKILSKKGVKIIDSNEKKKNGLK